MLAIIPHFLSHWKKKKANEGYKRTQESECEIITDIILDQIFFTKSELFLKSKVYMTPPTDFAVYWSNTAL